MLMLLGLVLFIASAVLAVGVFLYVQYLDTSAASKLDQLNRAKAAFEPALIAELTRLDDRMRAADEVLSVHIAPSTLFSVLQQLTLQTVAFSSLDFSAQNSSDMTLTMQGIAQSVNSIALEADLLSKSGIITSPIFSNMNRTQEGVRFDFTSGINAEGLRYRTVRAGGNMQQAPQEPATPFGLPQDMTGDAMQGMDQSQEMQQTAPSGDVLPEQQL